MATTPANALLQEFIECGDPERADALLETLVVEHAGPTIHKIVRYKLAFQGAAEAQDAEDVSSEVMVELLSRLKVIRESGRRLDRRVLGLRGGGCLSRVQRVSAPEVSQPSPAEDSPAVPVEQRKRSGHLGRLRGGMALRILRAGSPTRRRRSRASELMVGATFWRTFRGGRAACIRATWRIQIFERFGAPVAFEELVGIVAQIWGSTTRPSRRNRPPGTSGPGESDPAPGWT